MLTRDVKSHVNLPVLAHSTGVFIGAREDDYPYQRHLDPRVPGLSPEYSHEGGLQTVITIYFITDATQFTHAHAGPSFVGRSVHGPLSVVREREVQWSSTGPSSCLVGAKGAEQASVWSAPWPVRWVLRMRSSSAQCEVEVVERRVPCSPSSQHLPSEGPVRLSQLASKTTVRW
jgi:hypothetical protein